MALFSIALLFFILSERRSAVSAEDDDDDLRRFDCYPERASQGEQAVDQSLCEARGCLWKEPVSDKKAPWCYYPRNASSFSCYLLVAQQYHEKSLTRVYFLRHQGRQPPYGNHSENITVCIQQRENDVLRVKIHDSHDRYEVPIRIAEVNTGQNPIYRVEVERFPFSVKVTRKSDGEVIWDTSVAPMVFSDQYLQISTRLPSSFVYGFGEHEQTTFRRSLNWTTLGMFSRDQFPFMTPGRNVYGVHPFYMNLEKSGAANGAVLINSNAMEVTLQPTPALTYRTIGGILDFYIFLGPTPENIVQQYTKLIGRTFMPPYWSLGFQLCRFGYKDLDEVKRVVADMKKYGIPQDVQYGDIDYMERQLDFTYDKTFDGLPEFVKSIKEDGLKYIIILDPAISANETKPYPPYIEGVKQDVWIKDANGEILFGKVWPDYPNVTVNSSYKWEEQTKYFRAFVAFPDFFSKKTQVWWKNEIEKFHKIIDFDGLWIDMNEPANFVKGSVNGCSKNKFDNPPYKPYILGDVLADKTICMNAIQGGYRHYDVHSLYGWSQSAVTQPILRNITGKRSIVISRSTYLSSGKYAGHWLGDNLSAYYEMQRSIIGMLDFNLFGIPYIGADICGFIDDAEARLCQRWMQLGAFYPFSRNHNTFNAKDQHPTVFGEAIAKNSRDILLVRYRLLPYLYTLFYEAHKKGNTVVRPLLNEFTEDRETWHIDRQFLWGPALLVSPALAENQTEVKAYFPATRWFDYFTGKEVSTKAGYVTLPTPQEHINLHLRGGYVIPVQEPANNTFFSRRNPFGLIVSLDSSGGATGNLFWDDGESIDSITEKKFLLVTFTIIKNVLTMKPDIRGLEVEPLLEHIVIFGVVGGKSTASHGHSHYDFNKKSLNITGLKWKMNDHHQISWSTATSIPVYVKFNTFITFVCCVLKGMI